ncbi:MFS transporter [Sphingomonas tagetis]|uniref:MFS transporter n=1 Tax=Sphingomonas tagetis TaxID=2949092 RepID=UPI0020B7384A
MNRQSSSFTFTLALCFALAVIEGFDLQSAGVAAPLMGPAFGLTPPQMGWVFSAAIIGLTLGAVTGGRLSDQFGRKPLLIGSLLLFGTFSLLTAASVDVPMLVAMRFLTGLGLGGAFPILIAIVADASPPSRLSASVATVYAGMPTGGAAAAALSWSGLHAGWATVFIVGGIVPLLMLVPALMWRPDHQPRPARRSGTSLSRALFANGRVTRTLLLWAGSFSALIVLYLLLNWLPSLLVERGIGRQQAMAIQIIFNLCGAATAYLCGVALDRVDPRRVALLAGAATIVALGMLAVAPPFGLYAAAAIAGGGVMAIQSIVYATAPVCYPPDIRGLGVGAVVSVGRMGSILGPLLAAGLVAIGVSGAMVLGALVPIAIVSTVALHALSARRPST